MRSLSIFFVCLVVVLSSVDAFPEQGRWNFHLDQDRRLAGVVKAVYYDTKVHIKVLCDPEKKDTKVSISYALRLMRCYQETIDPDDQILLSTLHDHPDVPSTYSDDTSYFVTYLKSTAQNRTCDHSIVLQPEESSFKTLVMTIVDADKPNASTILEKGESIKGDGGTTRKEDVEEEEAVKGEADGNEKQMTKKNSEPVIRSKRAEPSPYGSENVSRSDGEPQLVIHKEGIFVITIKMEPFNPFEEFNYSAIVELEIKGSHGYLSAVDWPLLPFYGSMCIVYFIYGLAWLIVLALQWRDLLRIQFWIGGVIFLGMVEKAVFYAEYQSVNSTGNSVQGAVLFAELVSCLKRTLARMLVIIVSLGFGIVKPRLGPMLHRVVGIGGLYAVLCSLEAFLRVMRPKNDPTRTLMLAEVPLAVLDTAICWWIFSNLVQTTRTLRLRRNIVKLSLYRHFTNALIFACIASVAFMVWVYKAHNMPRCVADWKELWVDDAYWHLLFSVILLVIMILWRPTNNNQRYAFMPLFDAADDEDDAVMNDAFNGMKMRGLKLPTVNDKEAAKKARIEEDLSWVEENIPSSLADSALPLLDSDEEIMNTKFEMSKME